MQLPPSYELVAHLRALQRGIRDAVVGSRRSPVEDLAGVDRSSASDTIYAIDALVEPVIEAYCEQWGRETPMVVIAEGLEGKDGREVRVFPEGTPEGEAVIRVILDPIDGTRGIMYDKRPAWSLGAVAPNLGEGTRLRDCVAAVMTELPTSKMGCADVLWATKGGGAHGARAELGSGREKPLALRPSRAEDLAHGFAMVSHFFPATKIQAGELMNHILRGIGFVDPTLATVFDDQYICTGGQFYCLAMGQDRFNADLRPLFYRRAGLSEGLACHPYDCAGLLIAEEAGVVITGADGKPLDAPLDTTSPVSWVGYANEKLRGKIQPLVESFFAGRVV